jgi:hypothetical protein
MKSDSVVADYLALLDLQREEIFADLATVDVARLWQRPGSKEWSVGEHLAHATAVLGFCRQMFQAFWAVLAPIGYLRRGRPYETEIDDVYARPGFPLNVGWMWPPRYTPERPAALAALHEMMAAEHGRVRRFYAGKDEHVLGNTPLYDPAIGRLNMIQALQVGAHHDEHHFATIRRILR